MHGQRIQSVHTHARSGQGAASDAAGDASIYRVGGCGPVEDSLLAAVATARRLITHALPTRVCICTRAKPRAATDTSPNIV